MTPLYGVLEMFLLQMMMYVVFVIQSNVLITLSTIKVIISASNNAQIISNVLNIVQSLLLKNVTFTTASGTFVLHQSKSFILFSSYILC